jgi:hypothetical protein
MNQEQRGDASFVVVMRSQLQHPKGTPRREIAHPPLVGGNPHPGGVTHNADDVIEPKEIDRQHQRADGEDDPGPLRHGRPVGLTRN